MTKIGNEYSSWKEIILGVPQCSIVGPLFLKIHHMSQETIFLPLLNVVEVVYAIFQCFKDNEMNANVDKCHVSLNTSNIVSCIIKINEVEIKNSQSEKLLCRSNICRKASVKISASSRIAPYMDLPKRKPIMNAVFKSQFSYSPLTWMMHSRQLNNRINSLHERCLRVTYDDGLSSFEELL